MNERYQEPHDSELPVVGRPEKAVEKPTKLDDLGLPEHDPTGFPEKGFEFVDPELPDVGDGYENKDRTSVQGEGEKYMENN